MSIEEDIKKMLVDGLKLDDVEPENIETDAPLFNEGLGLDSLDAVELVVLLKKYYGIEIKDMEEGRKAFASVAAMADYIRANQGEDGVND